MEPSSQRLSRPVYEGLPWFYALCGVAALIVSYLLPSGFFSLIVGVAGFGGLLFGIVILLRRRDYRKLRSQYGDPDLLDLSAPPEKKED